MRKIIMILILTMIALTAFATPKVIRESKWNDEVNTYILMYDEDSLYGGSYYIYRHCEFYNEDAYERIIGTDLLEYWLARENNTFNHSEWDFTAEMLTFSQEEDKFVNYVRVTRR